MSSSSSTTTTATIKSDPTAPAANTSSPPASPSPSSSSASASANKPHLSEEQKKANHIASEKKRRTNIREQYDRLADMTPGLQGQGRSEGKVLEEVVRYGRELMKEREGLLREMELRGASVS